MKLAIAGVLMCAAACGGGGAATGPTDHPAPTAASGKLVDPAAALETKSEDVTITVGDRQVEATVVAPATPGPWPAVLLLAGSGPTDRDWNSPLLPGTNGSGKLLAEALAKHGAVVLRLDKAATGKNTAVPYTEMTLDTYLEEDAAALASLDARPDVRKDKVFVAGHSEGGLHATRLALAQSAHVAGVIYLSSASRSMADTVVTQVGNQLHDKRSGLAPAQADAETALLKQAFEDFHAGRPVDPKKASSFPAVQQLVAGMTVEATAKLMRGLMFYDNAAEAPKLTQPVLIVNGERDVQIDPELDAKHLYAAFQAAHRDATLHLSPEANHVLKHETLSIPQIRADLKAAQDAYNAPDRVLDADVLDAVVSWLHAHT